MNTRNLTFNELNELQVTFGSVEALLNVRNFNVIKLMRDFRHDWGDDGGFLISISSKNDKIYLHIIEVNYNITLKNLILEESDVTVFPEACNDYMIFDTCDDAIKYVRSMFKLIIDNPDSQDAEMFVDNEGNIEYLQDLKDEFLLLVDELLNQSAQYRKQFSYIFSAFSEFPEQNATTFIRMRSDCFIYTPNYSMYTDPLSKYQHPDDYVINMISGTKFYSIESLDYELDCKGKIFTSKNNAIKWIKLSDCGSLLEYSKLKTYDEVYEAGYFNIIEQVVI